jgi:dolichol-phosphate mannosyltransferase
LVRVERVIGAEGGDRDNVPALSVVVPMFNEEDAIPHLAQRLRHVLDELNVRYEVLAVDDGSTDNTPGMLATMCASWNQFRVIRLVRNSGHQAALAAGVASAYGKYVVTIDADLQDPPELIATMFAEAESRGLDVVYGVRSDRSADSLAKRWTAWAYYSLMRRLAGRQVPRDAGDFRLISRRVVDHIQALPEHGHVFRLIVPWLGFPSAEVHYARSKRVAGRSKYPLSRMVVLAADSVTSFSAAPLRIATWLGLVGVVVCLLLIVLLVYAGVTNAGVPGWASTLLMVTTLGAVQLLSLGLLGEYIGRLYEASQGRPSYIIGFDSARSDETASPKRSGEDSCGGGEGQP